MKILHVIANPKPAEESASKQVTVGFFEGLKKSNPGAKITTIDLYDDMPPYYDYSTYRYTWYPLFVEGFEPTDEEKFAVGYSQKHCAILNGADILVLTAPMWNGGVPAILKAWIDQVIMPNVTFSYGPGGASPLHKIKKLIFLTASGGAYGTGQTPDFFTPWIKFCFGFLGIPEIEIAWADGQNGFFFKDSGERKTKAVAKARKIGESL